jgi:hypothetical protein
MGKRGRERKERKRGAREESFQEEGESMRERATLRACTAALPATAESELASTWPQHQMIE